MAALPSRSELALGVPPMRSWRPIELFDQKWEEHGSRKWQVAKFSPTEDRGVGAFLAHDLQEGAAIQTYPKLTPKSQLVFRVNAFSAVLST